MPARCSRAESCHVGFSNRSRARTGIPRFAPVGPIRFRVRLSKPTGRRAMIRLTNALPRALALALALTAPASEAFALQGGRTVFDPEARRKAISAGELVQAQAACLAVPRDARWAKMPLPRGLKGSEDAASEAASTSATWAMMVLAGRSL